MTHDTLIKNISQYFNSHKLIIFTRINFAVEPGASINKTTYGKSTSDSDKAQSTEHYSVSVHSSLLINLITYIIITYKYTI